MTARDSTAGPAKKRGCLRRAAGCFGIVAALLLAALVSAIVLPIWRTRVVRDSLAPGMSTEEVVERARGWLVCEAQAGPKGRRVADFKVWSTGYGPAWSDSQRTYSTRAEMARALAAEMRRLDVDWTMTFGYITNVPKRIYFDVRFSPDGRVVSVSDTRFGTLD